MGKIYADEAMTGHEERLKKDFKVAVHDRYVSREPCQGSWGAATKKGDLVIIMGVDVEPDAPVAATLPTETDSTPPIPVSYYHAGPIRSL
jgi:hypothetical protein